MKWLQQKSGKLGEIILAKFFLKSFGAKRPQDGAGIRYLKFYGEMKHKFLFFCMKVQQDKGLNMSLKKYLN